MILEVLSERKITMPTHITGYVADELADLIDEMSEYHDIPRSRVLKLLLREGVNNRYQRIKMEQIDIKHERMLIELALDLDGTFGKEVKEHSKQIGNMPLPEGTTGVDLVTPHPCFGGKVPRRPRRRQLNARRRQADSDRQHQTETNSWVTTSDRGE